MSTAGWDFDKPSAEGGDKKKHNYTKFPVGVTRIRIIDEAPHLRWVHWMPQFQRSVTCPGRGCPIDELRRQQKANNEPVTYSMSRRFAINIYNYETNQVEIMEQGVGFFQDLKDFMTELKDEGKSLSDVIIKVRRRGSTKDDTTYRVDIDEIAPMESDVKVKVETDRVNLDEFFKPHTVEQILALLKVRENHKEAWVEIMTSNSASEEIGEEEDIEIR